ncbi:LysR substrate-binding domain-containing protein [Silvimonas sp.]|uniref:LysR substrate-binding domain-containing protein n=1 Tax=Silvimonas sp. TaxID=2650811 RepID=UPI0028443362|nr:LysR substrate-binding domain-containing protein [Silvimonas sp.]MDR3427503.1 LysR substrate-binding domain-containing protein [Silvimonas sp.]
MRRHPPLQALLAFEASARLGSFTRAAQELALTQSAISHQILQLEQWTGQPLFRRIGRGVALTAAGTLYLQTVSAALTLLADGRDRIEPYSKPDSVIVFCAARFASGWLLPRMRELEQRFADVDLWLVTVDKSLEIDQIDVDLIISDSPIRNPEIESTPLMADEAIAICGPQTAARLAHVPFPEVMSMAPLLYHEARPEWAPWLPELRRAGLAIKRRMTIDDPHWLVAAAREEAGIAMVSRWYAEAALARGEIATLPQIPGFTLGQLWLMRSVQPARSPVVAAVYDWLLQNAAGEICLKPGS